MSERKDIYTVKYNSLISNKVIIVQQNEPTPPSDWVDLGLPSGNLWCSKNIGASVPEEYGLFYQWGAGGDISEEIGYYENEFPEYFGSWYTCPFNNHKDVYDVDYLTRLDSFLQSDKQSSEGWVCRDLQLSYDAAYSNYSDIAYMPNYDDMKELINNTTRTNITENNIACTKYTSKINNNYIIIPQSGYYARQDGNKSLPLQNNFKTVSECLWTNTTREPTAGYTNASALLGGSINTALDRYRACPIRAIKRK